jgi:hypothetical protein
MCLAAGAEEQWVQPIGGSSGGGFFSFRKGWGTGRSKKKEVEAQANK